MKVSTIGASVLVVLTVLLVSRCVAAEPQTHSAVNHPPSRSGPAALPTPTGSVSGSFNGTDIAWLQLMIPMTEQAARLLELAPGKTSNPRLKRFAEEYVADRRTTLQELRDLLRRSGVPESNEHEGHDIPGMVIPNDFAALKRADGEAFDRLFTKDAREYLTQSVLVAKGLQKSGADPETKAFAAALEKTYSGQLPRLEP
ncbi:hypothetical protein GCM10022252_47640 [Streptosporangium oxazolinicum]|uniref:DUF305 domain-containing protein n=1 Tax=Streptosporangium oxazolinicum TaxID=909287 RepID=A0ABP8B4N3_9ACTN